MNDSMCWLSWAEVFWIIWGFMAARASWLGKSANIVVGIGLRGQECETRPEESHALGSGRNLGNIAKSMHRHCAPPSTAWPTVDLEPNLFIYAREMIIFRLVLAKSCAFQCKYRAACCLLRIHSLQKSAPAVRCQKAITAVPVNFEMKPKVLNCSISMATYWCSVA